MTAPTEFARPLPVDRVRAGGLVQTVTATAAECAALAERLGVPGVLALAATFRLHHDGAGRIAATAQLTGRLVRDCVLTLEPFETDIAEDFAVVFVPAATLGEAIGLTGDDEIPYAADTIDLGEATAEQVALTLDPYPHGPGAALPEAATEQPRSAFAVLAERRQRS